MIEDERICVEESNPSYRDPGFQPELCNLLILPRCTSLYWLRAVHGYGHKSVGNQSSA